MRPEPWSPPVALEPRESAFVSRLKQRSRFYVLLRQIRHVLLSEAFNEELAALYEESPRGQPPIAPGQLVLATLLQAYTGVSDAEVIEATVSDRRWQLVLDCWDAPYPPFAQGTLVNFRKRLVRAGLDRRLIERTVELAEARGGFSRVRLKLALDSSPLWGAGRVEDTLNLLGTALKRAVALLAKQAKRGPAEQAEVMGVPLLAAPSLKGSLDRDWSAAGVEEQALAEVLAVLAAVERQCAEQPDRPWAVDGLLAAAEQVVAQDVDPDSAAGPRLRRGVAADRRISIADAQQRHGRKSRRTRFDGYKRHAVRDLAQAGLIRAVAVTPANRPDAEAVPALVADLDRQGVSVAEWHMDRAYLSSALVTERAAETEVWCKPYPVANRGLFPKTAFTFRPEEGRLTCPAGVSQPAGAGKSVHFPAEACDPCRLRHRCTRSKAGRGRSVALHREEGLLIRLRQAQATPAGRAKLRQRVAIEHTLARLGQVQGHRARFLGLRKQLFDCRRAAAVINLQTLDRLSPPPKPFDRHLLYM